MVSGTSVPAKISEYAATRAGDTETMAAILAYAHHTERPLLYYNNEAELTMVVNLVYLSARDSYRMERENRAGIAYDRRKSKKHDCEMEILRKAL